ncbi:MAG: chitobiase/beta-hexosaminidase C-terminal domain-containing protein, partial [Bacteroidaceae bacterium]|nr:chitobiase/beta-hexosaminidase C-terminal domain-containing protein [Bacteroidaceae bacterium]
MKKLLSLLFVVLVAVGATAQDRKYWDFRTLSQETIDNILADSETWAPSMKDDGTFDRAADAKKISGELTANGTPIQELQGLTFGTAGLNGNGNNFMIATNRFRMTRNNMEIIFPKLLPGQTVTIRGRSANSGATDRGFKAGNDNLEYISGPKDGICVGNQAADYGSADYPVEEDGNYTLVWKVREDLGTTEPVDVVIKLVTGGLDMAEIWIDNGNNDQVEEIKKIAYLYTAKDGYNVEDDVVYNILSSVGELTTVDITNFTGAETDTVAALESNYDLLVISETISSTHAWKNVIKGMVNRVPMLNLKSFFYKNWGWGAGANPATSGSVVLTEAGAAHPLFAELGYAAGEELALYEGVESGKIIQGYTVSEGSFIADDAVLATVGGQNAIHVHGSFNTYMLFPLSSDAVVAGVAPTEDCQNLWMTIIDYLADTKSKVRQANKPAIKQTYNDGVTIVEFTTSVEGATIYYTLDGTEPTTASSVYTEALQLTEKATVKAMIVAAGYNNSDVAAAEVVVKKQAAAPAVTVTDGENGTKVITMTGAEGTAIHYNLSAAVPTVASPAYTEPIVVSRSTDICAIAVGTDMLDSDPVLAAAEIAAYPFRKDTLATVTFVESEGFVHTYTDEATGEEKTITIAN